MSHPFWIGLIIFVIVIGIIVGILLTWLSSRGKFMFLDNVVTDRAEVVKPWSQYKRLVNSLFLWRLGFASLLLFTGLDLWAFMLIRPHWRQFPFDPSLLGTILLLALLLYAVFVDPDRMALLACPFKALTGLDCASCGLTHSLHAATHLQFGLSLQFHRCQGRPH